jgi:general stress protein YciG
MAHSRRGFASMDREKQRQIASKGGRAAHAKGTAHEFTHQEAVEAGRKGGRAAQARSHAQRTQPNELNATPQQQGPTPGGWQGEEQPASASERFSPPMAAEPGMPAPAQT